MTRLGPPVLADGTPLRDLVDIDGRSVATRVLSDPEIFELEQHRIWSREWIFVGHVSELPSAGSYLTRKIGADGVIVTRDADDDIHVVLNACSHRAAQVCHAEQGTATRFRCPYHGWVYDQAGRLLGAPAERRMYRGGLDRANLGLPTADVAVRHGLIFARWANAAGPSLDDALGDFGFYLDLYFGGLEGGWTVTGPPQRWRIPTNWKIPAENFTGDAYHAIATHRSEEDAGRVPRGTMMRSQVGVGVLDPVRGHGGRCHPMRETPAETSEQLSRLLSRVSPAIPAALHPQLEEHLSDDQLQLLRAGAAPFLGSVFPNLAFLSASFPRVPDGPLEPGVTIRTWVPIDAGTIEFMSWAMVPTDADPDAARRAARVIAYTFGTAGTLEQDDTEAWAQIQRVASGPQGAQRRLRYDATTEADPVDAVTGQKWTGPGEVRMGFASDDNQWNWWRRWLTVMEGRSDER
ncbi:MAG: hypothetical protein ABS81_10290 [Pseudonocardia sp. SCN 72-86]|nr:MAG: hypothetical protein ABS81_10290 [Pseudonocardia sp. SCN 72-86]